MKLALSNVKWKKKLVQNGRRNSRDAALSSNNSTRHGAGCSVPAKAATSTGCSRGALLLRPATASRASLQVGRQSLRGVDRHPPPHRSKWRRAHLPASDIYRIPRWPPSQRKRTRAIACHAARPGRRSFSFLSFSLFVCFSLMRSRWGRCGRRHAALPHGQEVEGGSDDRARRRVGRGDRRGRRGARPEPRARRHRAGPVAARSRAHAPLQRWAFSLHSLAATSEPRAPMLTCGLSQE